MEQPYLKNELHHLEPYAIFEVIAFDSTETYVIVDDIDILNELKKEFPDFDNLEKYVYLDSDTN